MGAKQTKIEGSYLPDTPTLNRITVARSTESEEKHHPKPISVRTDFENTNDDILDPRSPNGCRTPISVLYTRPAQQVDVQPQQSGMALLRKRFLKGFTYNLNDPRSPSTNLNRTPLMFDDAAVDRTLNLDDTFADLFVETRAPLEGESEEQTSQPHEDLDEMEVDVPVAATTAPNEEASVAESFASSLDLEEETMPCPAVLNQTPLALQQQLDPRSPTYGVDRTPIIFTDDGDEEALEDAMLESILAALSLNLSNASSVASYADAASNVSTSEEAHMAVKATNKPTNKHLDRVRCAKKRVPPRKAARRSIAQRQRIYEDSENVMQSASSSPSPSNVINTTPKQKKSSIVGVEKRTPLSCVKNRPNLRSRSVESSAKSLKTRLPLTSYDDILNPQTTKMANIHIMQDPLEY